MVWRRRIRLIRRHAEYLPVIDPGSGKESSMKGDLHKCPISPIPITSKIRCMRSGAYWQLSSFWTILNRCMGDSFHALIELPSCHWSVGYWMCHTMMNQTVANFFNHFPMQVNWHESSVFSHLSYLFFCLVKCMSNDWIYSISSLIFYFFSHPTGKTHVLKCTLHVFLIEKAIQNAFLNDKINLIKDDKSIIYYKYIIHSIVAQIYWYHTKK